jgi:hypothetical protein
MTLPRPRNHTSAKKAGSSFERSIADSFAWNLQDDRIDRRVKSGAQDKGDIGGLRTRDGCRLVVECKNTTRLDLGHWVREAGVEAENDNAIAGIVVHKRRGKADPLEQYVTMTLRDLLLIGWGVTRA